MTCFSLYVHLFHKNWWCHNKTFGAKMQRKLKAIFTYRLPVKIEARLPATSCLFSHQQIKSLFGADLNGGEIRKTVE